MKQKEKNPRAAETAGSGLCAGCAHDPDCSFPRDPRHPIYSCEEVEVVKLEPVKPRKVASAGTSRGAPASPASARPISYDKGLCSDCANAPTCTFPRQEGGVWHCEEYC
jgi:hypothetical protein